MIRMVTVPYELLKEVLEQAHSDVEHERACNKADHELHNQEREKIYKLREIAGIEEE